MIDIHELGLPALLAVAGSRSLAELYHPESLHFGGWGLEKAMKKAKAQISWGLGLAKHSNSNNKNKLGLTSELNIDLADIIHGKDQDVSKYTNETSIRGCIIQVRGEEVMSK